MAKTNNNQEECPSCYICGCARTGSHPISMRQSSHPGPYFPFLETHEPPDGSNAPTSDGKVLACYVCFSILKQQWESYEKNKIPPVKRIYWLKRVDSGPYTGVEMGMQSEYASQVFGLTSELSGSSDLKKPNSFLNASKPLHCSKSAPLDFKMVADIKIDAKGISDLVCQQSATDTVVPKLAVQDEALDLSVDGIKKRKRSCDSKPEKNKKIHSNILESGSEVLDLSMPDKNAVTEVCYICGNHFTKGSLAGISAKALDDQSPFFPNLMNHSRPSGSRPMEASGKVLCCSECSVILKDQWKLYELNSIPHNKRMYTLKKSALSQDHFACKRCGQIKSLINMHVLPSLASSEHITFCNSCITVMNGDKIEPISVDSKLSKVFNDNEQLRNFKNFTANFKSVSPPAAQRTISENEQGTTSENSVLCCLCQQNFSLKQIQTLSMVPDSSKPDTMFFSFLKYLPQVTSEVITDDGRILSCKACYLHLKSQWLDFEKDFIPEDQRHFSLRAFLNISNSPRLASRTLNHTPPHSSPQSSSRSGNSSPIAKSSTSTTNVMKVDKGYHGQSLKELEIVPVTPESDALVLTPITMQRALNIKISCFLCSLTSKAGDTYAISNKYKDSNFFFPFLAKYDSAHSEAAIEHDNYLVCSVCFHSLVIQFLHYERNKVKYHDRVYDTHNFTCYVCGTKTYRKRLYILRVKNFPFLKEHVAPPAAIVVHYGHSVVACKDCAITLNAQYTEYDKWGLPVEKRMYNWVQRPPPPEFAIGETMKSGSQPNSGDNSALNCKEKNSIELVLAAKLNSDRRSPPVRASEEDVIKQPQNVVQSKDGETSSGTIIKHESHAVNDNFNQDIVEVKIEPTTNVSS